MSDHDVDRLAAYDEALVALTQELSYLVLLGWIESPVPAGARSMPAAIGIERMDTSAMLDALRYLDEQRGPDAIDRLVELGEVLSGQVRSTLSTNLVFEPGLLPQIDAAPYLMAYDQLLGPWSDLMGLDASTPSDARSGAGGADAGTAEPAFQTVPQVAGAESRQQSPDPVVPADGATDAMVDEPASDVAAGSGRTTPTSTSWMVIGGGLVLVLALAALGAFVIARRRRGRTGSTGVAGDAVLDAGRSIMAAVDLDGFLGSVAEQVGRLVGAEGAVIVDGRSWVPAGRELPGAAVLDRAMATGRSVADDGATVVPVVAHGHVVGVMVAWSTMPATEETLGAFAPLVGAALQGVRSRLEHEHLAFDDGLTGVGNRRRFDRDLERFVGIDSDRGLPVALAMVDVDHFKRFNDTHGHQTGDAVLRHVAMVISANVRSGDLVYRYGGEEFAVLLPGADLDDAIEVVERVRAAIAASPLPGMAPETVRPVTVSVGVSVTPPADGAAMVRAADGALYAAKSGGRNRVEAVAAPA
ncbi:MAG: GGDEF domain-containing protein [Actinobacteria bacterium]|nr:GGDEF domain-containing protein [Actinomycetota bacterium]